MDIIINKKYKSIIGGQSFSLPKFCILTGKNGSGKSHLLEAISNNQITQITDCGKPLTRIKYIPFNGLNPNVDSICGYNTIIDQIRNLWSQIQNVQTSYRNHINNGHTINPKDTYQWFMDRIGDRSHHHAIKMIVEKSGIPIEDQTEDTIRKFLDFNNIFPEEMFASQFATIFKAYHTRLEDNRYLKFKNDEYKESNTFLSDEEFVKIYGPPPWDLINEILANAKLSYRVNNPLAQSKESAYNLELIDPSNDLKISVNDLSTGENVLMSLALAIYNSTETGAKLDLLLLDEPDAALHPEFSKLLIDSLYSYIVLKADVSVLLTTHSPTTIAASEGVSIFEINKETRIPFKISKTSAINVLTDGLSNLRLTTDLRRQVFVESLYDVDYYEKIYKLIDQKVKNQFTPQFLPPHSRIGSNCTDVINIVSKLTELGNDLVYGIVDFDGVNTENNKILVLGGGNRYSIENYIFDPVFIGLLLIREKVLAGTNFNIPKIKSYIDCKPLAQTEFQIITDEICKILKVDTTNILTFRTISNLELKIPDSITKMQGHDLEMRILDCWPQLNNIKRGKSADNILKNFILDNVITDFPELLCSDFITLFSKIK